MQQNKPISLSAVVLAGGRGRRLGGQDKGLVRLQDKPLIEYSLALLKPYTERIMISANRNQETYQHYGFPVISDDSDEFAGPLAGILAALRQCQTDSLLVLACDIPFLPKRTVDMLIERYQTNDCDICCVEDENGLQPLVGILSTSLADKLSDYLAAGHNKVQEWFRAQQLCTLQIQPQEGKVFNINTEQELSKYPENKQT